MDLIILRKNVIKGVINLWWWILAVYLMIGIIAILKFFGVKPVLIQAPWLFPFLVILFPIVIGVLIKLKNDKGGRWI